MTLFHDLSLPQHCVSFFLPGAPSTTMLKCNSISFSFLPFVSLFSSLVTWKLRTLVVGGCSASEVSPFLRCNSLPRSASLPTELREDGFQPQTYLVQGVKALHAALKLWMKKELVSEHAFEIPDNVRPGHLIKELSKVIRAIEVRVETVN